MKKQAQFINSGSAERREYIAAESMDLTLTLCGYEVCEPGTQILAKSQDSFLLCLVRSGKGTCTVSSAHYNLEEHDLMLIFPGTEYSFSADPQEGCSCVWVGFTGMEAEACMIYAGFSREEPCRKTDCIHQLDAILTQTLLPKAPLSCQIRANGLLQVFLGDLLEEHTANAPGEDMRRSKTSEYVKKAVDYIAKHYAEEVKIKELADFVGINRSYLASSFKKATGYSPKEYLLNLRMEKAKSLLKTTSMPISSISGLVGYEDPLAFSRIFKRYSGLSPTDYREKHKPRSEQKEGSYFIND